MPANFNLNTENKQEWLTPPELIEALGEFDLDPCAPHLLDQPWATAKDCYWKELDGLSQPWYGRVWCNPPYGRETFKWLKKLADHGNGIALIFARTETKGFHSEVWNRADAVFFFIDRINFYHIDGTKGDRANAPSCLVIYGAQNIDSVKTSGLKGKLIILK